ncbi:unnamed protein product [Ilex paraguariensis]|uniref:Uncharacterized protein n=1 Tax=Ilex paraguariensis TaxID=185542 RepID=A0ABC8UR26_9AQUA
MVQKEPNARPLELVTLQICFEVIISTITIRCFCAEAVVFLQDTGFWLQRKTSGNGGESGEEVGAGSGSDGGGILDSGPGLCGVSIWDLTASMHTPQVCSRMQEDLEGEIYECKLCDGQQRKLLSMPAWVKI